MRLQAQAEVRKALHAFGLDHGTNQALFCRGAEAVRFAKWSGADRSAPPAPRKPPSPRPEPERPRS